MIQHHPHSPCTNLRCKLVRRLAHIGSTYSEVGASGKTGAVQFDGYRTFYGQNPDEDVARSFLLDRLRRLQSIIFIALSDGQAIGFAQLFPSFSSARADRTFILNDLLLSPEERGREARKALMTAAADYRKAVGAVRPTLSTAHDNLAAQSLYEGNGWSRKTSFVSYNLPLA